MCSPFNVQGAIITATTDTTRMTVNAFGQPLVVTDALDNVTQYAYDSSGVMLSGYTPPKGSGEAFTNHGPLLTSVKITANGSQLNFHYGAYSQPDSTWGSGYTTLRSYLGSDGRVDSLRVGVTDSSMTRYYYDSHNRDTSVVDANGHTTKRQFDPVFANTDSTLMPSGGYQAFRFDGYGRDTAVLTSGLAPEVIHYTAANLDSVGFDGVNASPTSFSYDGLFLTSTEDPKSQVYKDSLDPRGLLIKHTDPTAAALTYRYDGRSNNTSWTNRRSQMVTFTYDRLGRQLTKSGTNVVLDSATYNDSLHIASYSNATERDSVFADTTGWVDSVVTQIAGHRYRMFHHHDSVYREDSTDIANNAGVPFVTRRWAYDGNSGLLDSIRLAGRNAYLTTLSYNHDLSLTGLRYPAGNLTYAWLLTSSHGPYAMQFAGNSTIDNALNQKYGYSTSTQIINSIPVNVPLNVNGQIRNIAMTVLADLRASGSKTSRPPILQQRVHPTRRRVIRVLLPPTLAIV